MNESLEILRRLTRGELTLKDMLKFVESTEIIIRHKLWALEELGLVSSEKTKYGRKLYYITDRGRYFLDMVGDGDAGEVDRV